MATVVHESESSAADNGGGGGAADGGWGSAADHRPPTPRAPRPYREDHERGAAAVPARYSAQVRQHSTLHVPYPLASSLPQNAHP
jgi:hypothetical protein